MDNALREDKGFGKKILPNIGAGTIAGEWEETT